ncbi:MULTISPECIES: DUF2730 family protein [unclassified Gilliamella]|jgi:hypothetical protein|uniref:DUF2730 family protein n=1 Tax=unclassified Gilliamella TaxID=2685620 RepID=UPI00080E48EE|nr:MULTISPECIES: DUF2730 family protein [Gilliamella]NUE95520.1 DUF2730 family protein [Gilliamella sp. ESL0232]OCG02925.1 hypothetical protein A9G12_08330 [Gilliamella apicola]OCG45784.1 hypothetical protein A9G34_01420 [Gilliamella apicola]OCG60211.1 hypothetical protein A9G40_04750 [Gilliamella apicola]OCG67024.1 hypothetical protein A9G30_05865 [Gilliamella apicola]
MNFNELTFNWQFLQWVVMAVVGVYSWLIGRQSASQKELLDLRIRVTQVEETVKSLPTQHQVTKLIEKLSSNEATLNQLSDRLSGLSRQLDNINQFLLKNK